MTEWIGRLDDRNRKKIDKRDFPQWASPMLATLTHEYFSDDEWIFERKLDGERCLVFCNNGHVRLLSRNRKNLNTSYPELVEALEGLRRGSMIGDGEVVAFDGNVTSFSLLQGRMQQSSAEDARRSSVKVYYYLFDIIYADGFDLTSLDLRRRKAILKTAMTFRDPVRFLNHRNRSGRSFLKEACQKRWEGIMAKHAGSTYSHGRSSKWLKFKCSRRQEFVIGGYTDPKGERKGFGALLIGYYDGDNLRYAGKVGTGFDHRMLENLRDRFGSIERKTSPFSNPDTDDSTVHWVTPELVGEVSFTEWTSDGKLRHPSFVGLRRDKDPRSVEREG